MPADGRIQQKRRIIWRAFYAFRTESSFAATPGNTHQPDQSGTHQPHRCRYCNNCTDRL
jgi:hypothetical protein